MGLIYRIIIFALFVAANGGVFAQEMIAERAWFSDPSAQLTLEEVQQREFKPYSGALIKGYTKNALWIRLKINGYRQSPNDDGSPMPLVLSVRPAYLEDIRLYESAQSTVKISGNLHRKNDQEYLSFNPSFLLSASDKPRTLWLRVQTNSAQAVDVELLTLKQALNFDRQLGLLVTLYSGLLVVLVAVSAANWIAVRDRAVGWFAVNQSVYLVAFFCLFGVPRHFLPTWLPVRLPAELIAISTMLVVFTTVLFHINFLLAHKARKLWMTAMYCAAALSVLPLGVYFLGYGLVGRQITALLITCLPTLFLCTVLSCPIPWRGDKENKIQVYLPKSALVGVYFFSALILALQGLTLLGWFKSSALVLYGSVVYGLINSILIFSLLLIRVRNTKQLTLQDKLDLNLSNLALKLERVQRDDQEQLFVMLAHEMKTPLATLQMWMNAGQLRPDQLERAIGDMSRVIERCVHSSQISDNGLTPVMQTVQANEVTAKTVAACSDPNRVQFKPSAQAFPINTDVQMLTIVLSNLIDNACKYSAPNTPIQVSLELETKDGRDGCLWTICNQVGQAGFPDPEKVFTKYYRSPHARRQSGSGLGLYLVKRLITLFQGDIWFKATGEQVAFCFWLPLH